ncbi:MAG: S1C family serine protease [Eubacteriales bacterium]|nr:S1C family serine protease [Eubacteriales bacterium]
MQHQNKQEYNFISEQIRKKPFYRKKWFQQTIGVLGLAVLFGGAAGVTFAVVKPWAEKMFGSPEEAAHIIVVEESETEPVSVSEAAAAAETESSELHTSDTHEYIDVSDYRQLYAEMANVAEEAERSIVTVTGEISDLDLFREADERSIQSSGLIVAKNSTNFFIVTEWEPIEDASKITVTFSDGQTAKARLQKKDEILGTAVIKVSLTGLPEETVENAAVAVLGDTETIEVGMPVIAAGSPLGYSESLAFGMITSVVPLAVTDGQYDLLTTDMIGSDEGSGILLNLDGDMIGIIAQRFSENGQIMLCGLEISDLRESISDLSNDTPQAYLGLLGRDIGETISEELDMPTGMFVREVAEGSPAMHAGVQKADTITEMDGEKIENVEDYVRLLKTHEPGDQIHLTLERKSMEQYVSLSMEITLDSR